MMITVWPPHAMNNKIIKFDLNGVLEWHTVLVSIYRRFWGWAAVEAYICSMELGCNRSGQWPCSLILQPPKPMTVNGIKNSSFATP
jgi:hypothetical protein